LDLGHVAEHAESVGEPGWDEDLAEVLPAESATHPFPERPRAGTDVDRDVENLAAHHPHQLPLRAGALRMQAAKGPAHRARKDVVAAERAAVRGEEEPEHLELLRADVQGRSLAGDDLAVEVDLHLTEADDGAPVRRGRPAAEERLHPRQQLPETERLGQVV